MRLHQRLQLGSVLAKRIYLALAFAALFSATNASATVLIVIYTADGYWLGADGLRSSNLGVDQPFAVCKIHATKFGYLLKSGDAQGVTYASEQYSTDKEIEDLLSKSESSEEFKTKLREIYKRDIREELAFQLHLPNITPEVVELAVFPQPISLEAGGAMSRDIFLIEPGTQGTLLEVRPWSDRTRSGYNLFALVSIDWVRSEDLQIHANPLGGEAMSLPKSVRMFGEQFSYDRPDSWVQTHPLEAMREMLAEGHRRSPQHIGPPNTIVHVRTAAHRSPRPHWIEKGKCPSWSDEVVNLQVP
jgi:hypothetical protein